MLSKDIRRRCYITGLTTAPWKWGIGGMVDRTVEISDADLQRLLQAMRRSQRPMTLDELIELLQS